MLDIQFIRENKQVVIDNMHKKNIEDTNAITQVIELDDKRKNLLTESQKLRTQRNSLSAQVNETKKSGGDISELLKQVKEIPEKIKQFDEQIQTVEQDLNKTLRLIPNILNQDVNQGKSEDDNIELKRYGAIPKFDFEVKAHSQIAVDLGMADFESAARTSGTGFYYIQGDLALLNQALLRFAIDEMILAGFTYVETPLMLRNDIVSNVVDLGDQENQIYKIEDEDLYLIGTSEHSLIGRYVEQTLHETDLPIVQTSYSMSFRKEKGSHGLDERGLFRTHQFNKIEMIVICKPEESQDYYKKLQEITLQIFQKLELPVRVLQICSGDIGNLKHNQVDIECWSPRQEGFIEVGSCSNLTDAQARMLKIKYTTNKHEKFVPHTLNNTAIATSRALVALLENFQQADGTVKIPVCLHKYMYGKTVLQ
ncbi:MAG: seryl-tRNA synthetase [Candidatus Woesearchaeota archaeon]|jgi:seryl-tRNA synthetase